MSKRELLEKGFTIVETIVSAAPFGGAVSGALKVVGEVIQVVLDLLEAMKENVETSKGIKASINQLKILKGDFNKYYDENFPPSCAYALNQLDNSLQKCKVACKYILGKHKIIQFFKAKEFQEELENVKKELKNSVEYLKLAFDIAQMYMLNELQQRIENKFEIFGDKISYPQDGIYTNSADYTTLHPLSEPFVELNSERNGMLVTWVDDQNEKNNVAKYEVVVNPDTQQRHPFDVEKLHPQKLRKKEESKVDPLQYNVCFASPTITEGQLCEVKVRATNGQGPSRWSKEFLFRYKPGYPKQPQITSLEATGPDEVEIQYQVYQEKAGSVTECLISYAEDVDSDIPVFTTLASSAFTMSKDNPHLFFTTFVVDRLNEFTRYRFKVLAKNSTGESPWSRTKDVFTPSFVPGTPSDFKVSERTKDSISLSWGQPIDHPSALHKYRLRYMMLPSGIWIRSPILDSSQNEFTIQDLKPGTSYVIHLESINKMGQSTVFETFTKTKVWYELVASPRNPGQQKECTPAPAYEVDSLIVTTKQKQHGSTYVPLRDIIDTKLLPAVGETALLNDVIDKKSKVSKMKDLVAKHKNNLEKQGFPLEDLEITTSKVFKDNDPLKAEEEGDEELEPKEYGFNHCIFEYDYGDEAVMIANEKHVLI